MCKYSRLLKKIAQFYSAAFVFVQLVTSKPASSIPMLPSYSEQTQSGEAQLLTHGAAKFQNQLSRTEQASKNWLVLGGSANESQAAGCAGRKVGSSDWPCTRASFSSACAARDNPRRRRRPRAGNSPERCCSSSLRPGPFSPRESAAGRGRLGAAGWSSPNLRKDVQRPRSKAWKHDVSRGGAMGEFC